MSKTSKFIIFLLSLTTVTLVAVCLWHIFTRHDIQVTLANFRRRRLVKYLMAFDKKIYLMKESRVIKKNLWHYFLNTIQHYLERIFLFDRRLKIIQRQYRPNKRKWLKHWTKRRIERWKMFWKWHWRNCSLQVPRTSWRPTLRVKIMAARIWGTR